MASPGTHLTTPAHSHGCFVWRLPLPGSGESEPAGRGLHQRQAFAKSNTAEDHRDGGGGGEAVRDQQAAEGQPRLRLQDPQQVPGDRQN